MGGFQCSVEHNKDLLLNVITLEGELDIYSTPKLRELINESIADSSISIVLDCKELTYVDSTGLGALVGTLKEMSNRDRHLSLASVNHSVLRILQVTGLDRLFSIYPDIAAARAAQSSQVATLKKLTT